MTSDVSGAEGGLPPLRNATPQDLALRSAPHLATAQEGPPTADAERYGTTNQNPMFATRHSNLSEESPEPGYTSRNPIFQSTGAFTSEGLPASEESLDETRGSRELPCLFLHCSS